MNNDVQAFAAEATERESSGEPRYPSDIGGMMRFLWSRIAADDLSDADLEWLSCASESVQLTAMNLGKTLSGVAALVQTEQDVLDAKARGPEKRLDLPPGSGAFQPYGLPEFLCGMAEIADSINETVTISSDAECLLRERWKKRALDAGWKRGKSQGGGGHA
jgi:hypothetical protein